MLHWLAGQRAQDTTSGSSTHPSTPLSCMGHNQVFRAKSIVKLTNTFTDPQTQDSVDVPDTPAPVFAVRAFKHAIFGTPATVQPRSPRRRSNADLERPNAVQIARPGMTRPRSSGDAQVLRKDDVPVDLEPPSSPTKGILMTPGTVNARRKTVSFGEQVQEHEKKRAQKSGSSSNTAGKASRSRNAQDVTAGVPMDREGRSRTKLTEAFEQVREESGKRRSRFEDVQDTERSDPSHEWESAPEHSLRNEYDLYRGRTTREVSKLVTKLEATEKHIAAKDEQCEELSEQLRKERIKVDRLEKTRVELEALVQSLQEQLQCARVAKHTEDQYATDSVPAEAARHTTYQTTGVDEGRQESNLQPDKSDRPVLRRGISDLLQERRRIPEPEKKTNNAAEMMSITSTDVEKPRRRPRPHEVKSTGDLWTQALSSSQPGPSHGPPSPTIGRQVTSGTDATPLKSLSVNTMQQDTRSLAMSMGLQPPSPQRSAYKHTSLTTSELPIPSPIILSDQLDPIASSSPFQTNAVHTNPQLLISTSSRQQQPAFYSSTKENTSPASDEPKSYPVEKIKPSTAWTALNTPSASSLRLNDSPAAPASIKRIVSKTGEVVGDERLAAARARILARGKKVS